MYRKISNHILMHMHLMLFVFIIKGLTIRVLLGVWKCEKNKARIFLRECLKVLDN